MRCSIRWFIFHSPAQLATKNLNKPEEAWNVREKIELTNMLILLTEGVGVAVSIYITMLIKAKGCSKLTWWSYTKQLKHINIRVKRSDIESKYQMLNHRAWPSCKTFGLDLELEGPANTHVSKHSHAWLRRRTTCWLLPASPATSHPKISLCESKCHPRNFRKREYKN